ncbi:MAG: type II toxin-antitoxin system VapC family toxin [Planctomycetota bacterium]
MRIRVVDASVIASRIFPDECGPQARKLLAGPERLCAPDFVFTEVANVIWKRNGRGEIGDEESLQLLADAKALPLQITASDELLVLALELAIRTRRTVYDCLYLALAIRMDAVHVTGDKRLVHALSAGPFGRYVRWLGECV